MTASPNVPTSPGIWFVGWGCLPTLGPTEGCGRSSFLSPPQEASHTELCSPNKPPNKPLNRPPRPSRRLALQELHWGNRFPGDPCPRATAAASLPQGPRGVQRHSERICRGSFSCVRVAPMSSFYHSRILSSSQGNALSLISARVGELGMGVRGKAMASQERTWFCFHCSRDWLCPGRAQAGLFHASPSSPGSLGSRKSTGPKTGGETEPKGNN